MVGSCAREAWRVGAGVGVGDEDEEGGREEAVAVLGEGEVDIVGDCCLVVGRGIATARVGWL